MSLWATSPIILYDVTGKSSMKESLHSYRTYDDTNLVDVEYMYAQILREQRDEYKFHAICA